IRAVTGMGRVAFHGQVIRKEAIQIPNHEHSPSLQSLKGLPDDTTADLRRRMPQLAREPANGTPPGCKSGGALYCEFEQRELRALHPNYIRSSSSTPSTLAPAV
ncbi:hypothetical protein, partial [Candidatus Erwinia dacicola]|uniref:hypothetical protein n=1 Tax=Candidatus Erwinia dacicola TaxID=252393 RepID=UPI001C99149A